MKSTITPEEAAEFEQLSKNYVETVARAMEALRNGPAWSSFMEAETEQAAIVRRMKEIRGTSGQPWNA